MFSGGKHRITLNGHSVYEGEMSEQSPAQFTASGKDYEVAKIKNHYLIDVAQQGQPISSGTYSAAGVEVNDHVGQKIAQVQGICSVAGMVIGLVIMIGGNIATGVIPGGAIGGAIGGGVGGGLGAAVGNVIGNAMYKKD